MKSRSILLKDPAAFREKVSGFKGDLAAYWDFFVRRARANPCEHPLDQILVYLANGDRAAMESFREEMLKMARSLPSRDLSNQGQFHQWTNAFPLVRWGLAFDLVARNEVFSSADRREIAEAFLGFVRRQYWSVAHSRMQTGDNQFLSVIFACCVFGHLFGTRHHDSAFGREIESYGLQRLADSLGHISTSGYSGEGYYHNQVVAPLAVFIAAFYEGMGQEIFEKSFPPNGVTVKNMVLVDYYSMLPGGLCPPFDASYEHRLHVKMNATWLARRSGEPGYLEPLKLFDLFEADSRPGWGRDDEIWTWLWWPDEVAAFDDIPKGFFKSWAHEDYAMGLLDLDQGNACIQNFDIAQTRETPSTSRFQSDPGNLTLIAGGVPLTLDGGNPEKPEDDKSVDERRGSTAKCGVGYHNCLVIDREYGLGSPKYQSGELLDFISDGVLSIGTADITNFYSDFNARRVARRNFQLGGGCFIIHDEIEFDSDRDVTFQLYVRPYAEEIGMGHEVVTPEKTSLRVEALQEGTRECVDVAGRPVAMERRCQALRYRYAGSSLELDHVLRLSRQVRNIEDLSSGWSCVHNPEGAPDENFLDGNGRFDQGESCDLSRNAHVQRVDDRPPAHPQRHIWDYMNMRAVPTYGGDAYDEVSREGSVWFRKKIDISSGAEDLYLRFERPAWYFRLYLNGKQVSGMDMDHHGGVGRGNTVLPLVLPLAGQVRPGETLDLRLCILSPHATASMGRVSLEVCEENPVPVVNRKSEGVLEVVADQDSYDVILSNRNGGVVTGADFECDGESALIHRGTAWQAVKASRLECAEGWGFQVRGGRVSMAYRPGLLVVDDVDPDTVIEIKVPEGRVVLFTGCTHEVLAMLEHPVRLRVMSITPTLSQAPFVGEQVAESKWLAKGVECVLQPSDEDVGAYSGLKDSFEKVEFLHRLAGDPKVEAGECLIKALKDNDWQVSAAAASLIGKRMDRSAEKALLERLEKENAEDVYHGLIHQDDFPQWPGGSNSTPLESRNNLPENIPLDGHSPEAMDFAKRWRLKQCLIEALGLIAATSARELLEKILLTDEGNDEVKRLGMRGSDFYPVRKSAAVALGLIGDRQSLKALRVASEDKEVNTRRAAVLAIEEITKHD